METIFVGCCFFATGTMWHKAATVIDATAAAYGNNAADQKKQENDKMCWKNWRIGWEHISSVRSVHFKYANL